MSKQERVHKYRSIIHERVMRHQKPIIQILNAYKIQRHRVLWVQNQLAIQNVPPYLLTKLSTHPTIQSIITDIDVNHMNVHTSTNRRRRLSSKYHLWGIERVHAEKTWRATKGKGSMTGLIDTGIQANHEAIGPDRVKAWLDAVNGKEHPYDNDGHGTHVAGTIGGKKGIGIAPDTDFIVCKAFDTNRAKLSALAKCAEFMLCPDPWNKCSLMPDVINNSWFKNRQEDRSFDPYIALWKEVGIIAVFCTGNNFDAKTCKDLSVKPPGRLNRDVIIVGSTTEKNQLSKFSRQGDKVRNPDIVAPGSSIWSASSPDAYGFASGTSMATPHVTGTIALMISVAQSVNQELTFEQIRSFLIRSASHSLRTPEFNCTSSSTYPNPAYGYGLLNTLGAIQLTQATLGLEMLSFSSASKVLFSYLVMFCIIVIY